MILIILYGTFQGLRDLVQEDEEDEGEERPITSDIPLLHMGGKGKKRDA
jgi:hypothetical protein